MTLKSHVDTSTPLSLWATYRPSTLNNESNKTIRPGHTLLDRLEQTELAIEYRLYRLKQRETVMKMVCNINSPITQKDGLEKDRELTEIFATAISSTLDILNSFNKKFGSKKQVRCEIRNGKPYLVLYEISQGTKQEIAAIPADSLFALELLLSL